MEEDRDAGTGENEGGRWPRTGRRRIGMREPCQAGGRRRMTEIKFFNLNFEFLLFCTVTYNTDKYITDTQ